MFWHTSSLILWLLTALRELLEGIQTGLDDAYGTHNTENEGRTTGLIFIHEVGYNNFKDAMMDDSIDVEVAVAKFESSMPPHLLSCIEMIIFGDFEEFLKKSINAFYDSGTVYISNVQDDVNDILDDLIHELSHAVEEKYGYEIYGDQKVHHEFYNKKDELV